MARITKVSRFAVLAVVLVSAVLLGGQAAAQQPKSAGSSSKSTTLQTATDAYLYGYPLLLAEYTREVMLATQQLKHMNEFTSSCYLLGPTDTSLRRPNNDTLYTQSFLDLGAEPLILHVPDTSGFYFVVQIMDAWTNTFAAPGTRTTGSSAQDFAIVGPDWKGQLPRPMTVLKAPTNMVWIIGRTEVKTSYPPEGTCSPPPYNDVWAIMQQYSLTPLSRWPAKPAPLICATSVTPHLTPPELIAQLTGVQFFQKLSTLMQTNPAAVQDMPALKKFESIGFVPGAPFNPPADMVADINAAPAKAVQLMNDQFATVGEIVNNWQMLVTDIGTYGTDYLTRAAIALNAPAANLPADGFYPSALYDEHKIQLNGARKYVIHLNPVPPVHPGAFWSVTAYDKNGYLVANDICRYAIHSTDAAVQGQSAVDILLQPDRPTDPSLIGFWLPIPVPTSTDPDSGAADFSVLLRIYWPEKTALKGKWVPPPIQIQQ